MKPTRPKDNKRPEAPDECRIHVGEFHRKRIHDWNIARQSREEGSPLISKETLKQLANMCSIVEMIWLQVSNPLGALAYRMNTFSPAMFSLSQRASGELVCSAPAHYFGLSIVLGSCGRSAALQSLLTNCHTLRSTKSVSGAFGGVHVTSEGIRHSSQYCCQVLFHSSSRPTPRRTKRAKKSEVLPIYLPTDELWSGGMRLWAAATLRQADATCATGIGTWLRGLK